MRKFNLILGILLVSEILPSCSTMQTVSPLYLLTDASKSVTLYLFDGRIISYSSGEYKVFNQDGSSYISGTGLVSIKGVQQHGNFLGKVYFRDIKEIKIIESPPTYQTIPLIIIGSLVAGVIIFLLTFRVSNI